MSLTDTQVMELQAAGVAFVIALLSAITTALVYYGRKLSKPQDMEGVQKFKDDLIGTLHDMRTELRELRQEGRKDVHEVRDELKELRLEVRQDISDLKTETRTTVRTLGDDLGATRARLVRLESHPLLHT